MKKIGGFLIGIKEMFDILWNSSKSLTILLIFNNLIRNALWPLRALVVKEIVDIIVICGNNGFETYKNTFFVYIILFFILFWLNRIWWPLNSYTQTLMLAKLSYVTRKRIINIMEKVHLSFFDYAENRDVYDRALRQADDRQPINAINTIMGLISLIVSFSTALVAMITINVPVTVLLLVSSVPSVIWENRFNQKSYVFEQNATREKRKLGYYFSLFFDKASAKEIKIFKVADFLSKKHSDSLNNYYSKYFKLFQFKLKVDSLFWIILQFALMLGYFVIIRDVSLGGIDLGSLSFFLAVAIDLQEAIKNFGSSINGVINSSKYFNNLLQFEKMNAEAMMAEEYVSIPQRIEKIVFENVTFTYPNSEKPALENVSFTMYSPQSVMIVGENGAGKTTLIKLLLRFYKPDSGAIYINDININRFSEKEYYKLFSACFQEYMNYGFSLKENIILADQKVTADRFGEIIKTVDLEDLISKLPKKEETCLLREFDEDGVDLSGGQYNKIAIARAMIKDAPIVLLDEPNAALDAKAEKKVFDLYEEITNNKLGIMITHRLQKAVTAQLILVFKDGKLIESGEHNELLKHNGEYAALFELQAKHYRMI